MNYHINSFIRLITIFIVYLYREFKYWLRGSKGDERVTIADGNAYRNVLLNLKPQNYIALRHNISIEFTNDMGSRHDVYFSSETPTSITAPYLFETWQCGRIITEDKNPWCDRVRNGVLAWGGKYVIIFKGIKFLLHHFLIF